MVHVIQRHRINEQIGCRYLWKLSMVQVKTYNDDDFAIRKKRLHSIKYNKEFN